MTPFALKRHTTNDDGDVLLQRFQEEAKTWYKGSLSHINNSIIAIEDDGGKNLLRLLVWVRKLVNKSSLEIRDNIRGQYNSILNALQGVDEEACTVWLLEHNFSTAKDLLETVKEGGNIELIRHGFWVVNDNRKSSNIANRHVNLSRLLDRGEFCRMKFEMSQFGNSLTSPIAAGFAQGPSCNLHNFIVKSMALEMAIDKVMKKIIGEDADVDVFRKALFYHVSSDLQILYDNDVDLDRHFDTARLGFKSGESLIDAKASHLKIVCKDDYDEQVVEVYEFLGDEMDYIAKGDCKVAHNIPLVDDGFGLCATMRMKGFKTRTDGCLRVICGVTRGAIIASMFGTRTSVHVEDSLLATFNILILGAPKIWYIVPFENGEHFQDLLQKKGLLEAAFEKRCFVQAFANGSITISKTEMRNYGVCRVVQHPGTTIMTIPGLIFHWTISTGFSLADSVNYYCQFPSAMNLKELQTLWTLYEKVTDNIQTPSSTTSKQYFDMCEEFGLL